MINDRADVVTTVLTLGLVAFGLLILLVTGIIAVTLMFTRAAPLSGVSLLLLFSATLFAGATLAILCFLLALLLRLVTAHLRTAEAHEDALRQMQVTTQFLEQSLRDTPPPPASALLLPPTVKPSPVAATHPHTAEEKAFDASRAHILDLLQRIHDTALMTESQRAQLAAHHWQKRKIHLTELIERQVLTGDFVAAQGHVDELLLILPTDPEVQSLVERVSTEYTLRLTEDLAAARAQLRQLMSVTAWQEAQELVISLQRKYPGKPEIEHLMHEVVKERDKHEREAKERLLADIADASEHRQWRRAAGAAEDFINRFPADSVAERLRIDLPMLYENAASQDRKEQEQHFKELLKQHRYEEALTTARHVIEKHPGSLAATELAKLLPRVEELHRQERTKKEQPAAQAV